MKHFAIKFEKGTSPVEVNSVIKLLVRKHGYIEIDNNWNKNELKDPYYSTKNFYIVCEPKIEGLWIYAHSAEQSVYSVKEFFEILNQNKMEKLCIKGGAELRDYLKKIGSNLIGNAVGRYYFRKNTGGWDSNHHIPEGYKVVSVEEFKKVIGLIIPKNFYLQHSPELKKYFAKIGINSDNGRVNKDLLKDQYSGGIVGDAAGWFYYQEYDKWTYSKEVPLGYTLITLDQFINQQPKNQTDMSAINTQPIEKQLSITKTETILIDKKEREVTITVLTTDFGRIRAGYAVRNPEDKKSDQDFAKQISTGRALNDKTTLVNYEYTQDLKKKFVLYAVAEQLFRDISYGKLEIKIGK